MISIHAPREGGDRKCKTEIILHIISIHAPREGGDEAAGGITVSLEQFQSTPPARGATAIARVTRIPVDISIHAPREGGDEVRVEQPPDRHISIHAPREGGDSMGC